MKQIQRRKTGHKKFITIVVALVLLLVAYLVFASYNHLWPFARQDTNDTAPSKKETNNATHEPVEKSSLKGGTTSKNVDTTKTTDQVPKSQDVNVDITRLESTGDSVIYEARASSTDNGTCSAIFTNDLGKPVTRNTEAKSGICGPVTISVAEFDAIGTWNLTLRYYTNNQQAVATKEIEVR